MKFQTPAFVRVENPQERRELIDWLCVIADKATRTYQALLKSSESSIYVYSNEDSYGMYYVSDALILSEHYDCGTNIPLFEALAAMNDENDREQWFVSNITGDFSFCRNEYSTILRAHGDRKATAEEVISHFKNKRHE